MRLWPRYGMAGVRSTIHYDESYNFYVQIFGNKRWWDTAAACHPHRAGQIRNHSSAACPCSI